MNSIVYIYTDGSGTKSSKPCGFASVIHHVHLNKIEYLCGGQSCGSNNFSELMAILQGLYYLQANFGYDKYTEVNVFSDSQWSIRVLKGEYKCSTDAGLNGLVVGIKELAQSWNTKFVWMARSSNPFNVKCDEIAGKLRKQMVSFISE